MPKEDILAIIKAAVAAPSGDNSQPWKFVVRGNTVEFHYKPDADNPILNAEEGGTLIAVGAALQNAVVEATALGYRAECAYQESGSLVASLVLTKTSSVASSQLREAIYKRHSNRRAYEKNPLDQITRENLQSIAREHSQRLTLVENAEEMLTVARALTVMEEVALSHKDLHALFFESISWSEPDNRAGKKGLYIKTLELPPPAQALFPLLRNWTFANMLAHMGFPATVAKQNAEQNASASAIGILSAPRTSRETYVRVGQCLEHVWLFATSRGKQMQIVTGLLFLARATQKPGIAALFTEAQLEKIKTAYDIIGSIVGETPIVAFRVGEAGPPTAVAYRREPEVVFQ